MVDQEKLRNILYNHFFDSSLGINRERLEALMDLAVKSAIDWSTGISGRGRTLRTRSYVQRLKDTDRTDADLEQIFSDREQRYSSGGIPKPVSRVVQAQEGVKRFLNGDQCAFPASTGKLEDVVVEVDKETNPSIRFNEHFMGEQHPYGLMSAMFAGYIGLHLNENAIAQVVSPTTSFLEKKVTAWLADLASENGGFYGVRDGITDEEFSKMKIIPSGNIVGGGTVANLTALLVARNKLLHMELEEQDLFTLERLKNEGRISDNQYKSLKDKRKIGVAEVGLRQFVQPAEFDPLYEIIKRNPFASRDLVILTSDQAHYSITKLGGYIGVGTENCWKVKTDENYRMDVNDLQEKLDQAKNDGKVVVAVVATAGTSGMGSIDPLNQIADVLESNEDPIYFHVDAAHGGGFLASSSFKEKFKGIERADSITMDGHKMFYTHYSCGGIIFKDKTDPAKFLKQSAPYILDKNESHYDSGKSTVEGSRGVGGILQLFAAIKSLGFEGYGVVLDHIHEMTKYLGRIADDDPEVEKLNDPELNIISIRYVPDGLDKERDSETINEINTRINQEMYRSGKFYLGSNVVGERNSVVQKIVVVNPYTTTTTMDLVLREVKTVGNRMYREVMEEKNERIVA